MSFSETQAMRTRARAIAGRMSENERQKLLARLAPRMTQYVPDTHVPHATQQLFLTLRQQEAFFGGAGGGGKSDALLMAALQYADVPGYSALILRRTYADLVLPGAIMDRANTWLRNTDARPKDGGITWLFPGGGRLTFGYLQRDADKYRYASAEFQYIAFDELTHFPSESTYTFLFSRMRKPQRRCLDCGVPIFQTVNGWRHRPNNNAVDGHCFSPLPDMEALGEYGPARQDGMTLFDVPLRMRSASNPGGPGSEWVKGRFVDPATRAKASVFVPSLLTDNPSLSEEDYRASLEHLHPVDRERMLNGDWDVRDESGFFKREWFNVEPNPPAEQMVRHWDMAATADGGDWTVGTLLSRRGSSTYVVDVVRAQVSSKGGEDLVRQTAQLDGVGTFITMEQEPGSSGVALIDHYSRNILADYAFEAIKATGSKIARATPMAGAAEKGWVYLKPAPWNAAWLNELTAFPDGLHDDQVDSASGAFNYLNEMYATRVLV